MNFLEISHLGWKIIQISATFQEKPTKITNEHKRMISVEMARLHEHNLNKELYNLICRHLFFVLPTVFYLVIRIYFFENWI